MQDKKISEDFPSLTTFGKKKKAPVKKKFIEEEQKKDFGSSLF